MPENAVESNLQHVQTLFMSLVRLDSYIGFESDGNLIIQMLLKRNAIWWLELLDTSRRKAIGTEINIPMAERVMELLYSGDSNLEKFKQEYSFLRWKEVKLNQSS